MKSRETARVNGRAPSSRRRVGVRSELDGLRARATGRLHAGAVRLPCDVHAPGAARLVVAQRLRDRVAAGVLDNAQLVVSELVTNSVRHSGARVTDAVVLRVEFTRTVVRVEVEDCGRAGVIAPRRPDFESGGGFGLQLVQALSERWGLERVAQGGIRVWAQLARTPVTASASTDASDDRGAALPSRPRINQRAGRGQTPATREKGRP